MLELFNKGLVVAALRGRLQVIAVVLLVFSLGPQLIVQVIFTTSVIERMRLSSTSTATIELNDINFLLKQHDLL